MNVHPCKIIRDAEQQLFAKGVISSDMLMDQVIDYLWKALQEEPEFSARKFKRVIVYAGKGNNAGDAIGLAAKFHCNVLLHSVCEPSEFSPETRRQYEKLQARTEIHHTPYSPNDSMLVIDGLLGSGVNGKLRPEYEEKVQELNSFRESHPNAVVLSIDIPTGLHADTGELLGATVKADVTAAIGCVKPGMLVDGAEDYVGRLLCIPLNKVPLPDALSPCVTDAYNARSTFPRPYSYFKNRAGRVNIVAGSIGYVGAAQMCAEAALAAGAGLVALYCHADVYPILAARVAPEVMVNPVQSYAEVPADGAQALVIGPGLGNPGVTEAEALRRLLHTFRGPVVLDADGLNLAARYHWSIPSNAILTPHPGEMRRLFPQSATLSRIETVQQYLAQHPCTLLLKGARSIISNGTFTYYNSTGGPYMANGGQGDVLAGAIGALATQSGALSATVHAAYACGRAAAFAHAAAGYPPAIRASQVIEHLPRALS